LFQSAQKRLADATYRLSDEKLLEKLTLLLTEHGKLSCRLIDKSGMGTCAGTYVRRFGGLFNVYARLGYDSAEAAACMNRRLKMLFVRRMLIQSFLDCFPGRIEEKQATGRFRAMLRVHSTGLLISLVLARFHPTRGTRRRRWLIYVPKRERKHVAILAIMNEQNTAVTSMRVLQNMNYRNVTTLKVPADSPWLHAGEALARVEDLLGVLKRIRSRSK
jgi:hypothetical protein